MKKIRFFQKKQVKELKFCQSEKSLSNCIKYEDIAIQARENSRISKDITEGSSSEEEHMENALALGAEEGRDKLR